ncbi:MULTISPECIES: Spy/CpxP family protein refolding chaperone [unclassified Snodgrassella]|uniref:Spy/CpxP family protein refolding chaperone n=1 Tax=unclassified Snodgrassella TaxID=2625236 RepID=UPI0018DC7CC8|nr:MULTISPECIES: Spy/CpxP family protein refolding chaperone [unclassified Snodgrassella]MBI0066793.1 Spy/CpxP family protein refolding chaperone [Snodgrassella sp. M0110]MBI0076288.1 Spy/CpxP family protein refolding chaperone [Snodgrassella sp. M0118]MBI0078094.1 Spy/CpxP family protein refolding chaperone [Snodgrassella sp. M0112]
MKTFIRVVTLAALSSMSMGAFAAAGTEQPPTAVVTETETVVVHEQKPVLGSVNPHSILPQLNLSNQQRALVQKIDHQYASQRPLMSNENRQILANLQQERKNLVVNKQFDDVKAKNMIAQEQRLWAEQQQARADYDFLQLKREHDIYQILTPKQQQQYWRLRQQQKLLHSKAR